MAAAYQEANYLTPHDAEIAGVAPVLRLFQDARMEHRVTKLEENVVDLRRRVDDLHEDVREIKGSVARLECTVAKIEGSLDARFEAVDAKLVGLHEMFKAELKAMPTTAKLTALLAAFLGTVLLAGFGVLEVVLRAKGLNETADVVRAVGGS